MPPFEPRNRMPFMPTAFLYIAAGFGYDGLQLLFGILLGLVFFIGWIMAAFVSLAIAVIAFHHFLILNKLHGVTIIDKVHKIIFVIILRLCDFLPLVGALPLQGVSALLTVLFVWREDRQYNKEKLEEYQQAQQALQYQYQQAYAAANDNMEEERAARSAANDNIQGVRTITRPERQALAA